MPTLPKNAISYRRFSSGKQAKGSSIARQAKLATKYANDYGLTLSDAVFEDLGVSAYHAANSKEDAGLGKLLLALRQGKIQTPCTLLVENLDRLSRAKIKVAMRQLMDITDAGAVVVTLVDGRIYTEDMEFEDFLMAGLTMQRAHEESDSKSKRLKSTWQERQSKKGFIHKNCPYWLTPNDAKTQYIVLEDKVAQIHEVFAMALSGLGSHFIANELNAGGSVAPKGGKWSTATITKLLNNRAVLGEYQPMQRAFTKEGTRKDSPSGEPIKGFYPVILSEVLFNQVQAAVKSRLKGSHRRNATRSHLNLVKHSGQCGCCGGTLSLKQQQKLYYLQCSSRCESSRPVSLRYLQDWLKEVWVTADFASVDYNTVPESKELAALEVEHTKFAKLADEYNDEYEETGDEDIRARAKKASGKKREIAAQIAALKEELAPLHQNQAAQKERARLVEIAFQSEITPEVVAARNRITALLAQLKGIVFHKSPTDEVTLEVKTAQDESKIYRAAKNPYHAKSKHLGSIWKEV